MEKNRKAFRKIKRFLERLYVTYYSLLHPMKKQVLFESFSGKQYSDNPRAISEKLHQLYPDYTIYWKLNNKNDKFGIIPRYVKFVPDEAFAFFRFNYLKVLAESFCYVTNEALEEGMPKLKKHYFLAVWHGDKPIKKIAADLKNYSGKPAESKLADLMISGCNYGEKILKSAFMYSGPFLTIGQPRSDVLLSNSYGFKEVIRKRLGLEKDVKYLLYAPTFIDNKNHEAQFNSELSISKTIKTLEKKTAHRWLALSRSHSAAYGGIQYTEEDKKYIIDVSDYPDIAEILLVSDMLITDYSSTPGDAALIGVPSIFFQSQPCTRPTYIKMEESPFWTAHSQEELEQIINQMNDESIKQNCEDILSFYGNKESGNASVVIADLINKWYEDHFE